MVQAFNKGTSNDKGNNLDSLIINYIKGDDINLKIRKENTPCGLCSSSGKFGHSLSMGRSDLVIVLSGSAISADGAATAIANSISNSDDIPRTIDHYKKLNDVKGILIVKDSKVGIWGNLELVP